MAVWMLYLTVIAAAFCVAGVLAEHGLRQLGLPVRWVWASAMAATVLLPLAMALAGRGEMMGWGVGNLVSAPVGGTLEPAVWSRIPSDPGSSTLDRVLVWAWIAASLLTLGRLILSTWALRRSERSWRTATVAGHPVLLSAEFGPAVVGAWRPRIVLPSWVLEWAEPHQRLIVMHEREHVRAGDSRLLLGSLLLLAFVSWCLPVWWQFHRLRQAMETDCDARLLATARAEARDYATLLVEVAGRPARRMLAVSALAPARAELERRIQLIIIAGGRERSSRRGACFLAAAVVVALALWSVPAPAALPNVTFAGALGTPAAPAPAETGDALPDWLLADGSLPGTPGEERLAAEVLAHHSAALAAGLRPGSIIWFVVGDEGEVKRTGIEVGTEEEVAARIRSRYPEETSDFFMGFEGVPAGSGNVRVVWLTPAPPFLLDDG
jgi:bla regulator protein blaR1